jgi:hypothetical protein
MNIISCTEASELLKMTKVQVRKLIERQKLTNYGNDYRYMVLEDEVLRIRDEY